MTAVRPLANAWARLPEERRQTLLGALGAVLVLVVTAVWFAVQVGGSLPDVAPADVVGRASVQGSGPGLLDLIASGVRLAIQPAVAE